MLTPAQVIPFLTHDDPDIRSRARNYLVKAHDPAPATADDFWAAADKVPPDEQGLYLDRLGLVPQTENSLKRLLEELPKVDPASADSLRRTLERLDFELLRAQWETIRASEAVAEPIKQHLQARLDLANEPPEPLWDRMKQFLDAREDKDFTEADELEADRMVEAIARHPDVFRERVLADLRNPNVGGWTELFVTDLAGEMRLADAVDALIDKLRGDSDFLWELATDALVHIGGETVVRRAKERFGQEVFGVRIFCAEVLGRIKRPESQAAVLELLEAHPDVESRTPLLGSLVDLMVDDDATFELLRAAVKAEDYDRMDIHLDEELLRLATMTGRDFPEAAEWRNRIERERAEWAMGMSNVDQALQPLDSFGTSSLHTGPLRPGAARSAAAVADAPAQRPKIKPFKRESAKVGRNEPCPCGSGKKYKKCHGK